MNARQQQIAHAMETRARQVRALRDTELFVDTLKMGCAGATRTTWKIYGTEVYELQFDLALVGYAKTFVGPLLPSGDQRYAVYQASGPVYGDVATAASLVMREVDRQADDGGLDAALDADTRFENEGDYITQKRTWDLVTTRFLVTSPVLAQLKRDREAIHNYPTTEVHAA